MTEYQTTLERVLRTNSLINPSEVRKVLILYMEKVTYIGDFSTKADKLHYFKAYFVNAHIDINFSNGVHGIHGDLLKHNPYLDAITSLQPEEIDFEKYDVVFCAAQQETELLRVLHDKYPDAIAHRRWNLAVFSISALLLVPDDNSRYIFPVCEDLYKQVDFRPGELYLADEERMWADRWLESNGVQPDERLYAVLDSTSHSEKLLNADVYLDYLKFLLRLEGVKVLIFDERSAGKADAYREQLSEQEFAKMIFAEGLGLREALCILGSGYIDLLFGPCTGLVHCASSIYNRYVREGMSADDAPVMITYTGKHAPGDPANNWWGSAPLVNCLMLKERDNEPRLYELKELTEEEKKLEDALPCSMYTSDMLVGHTTFLLKKRGDRNKEIPAGGKRGYILHL